MKQTGAFTTLQHLRNMNPQYGTQNLIDVIGPFSGDIVYLNKDIIEALKNECVFFIISTLKNDRKPDILRRFALFCARQAEKHATSPTVMRCNYINALAMLGDASLYELRKAAIDAASSLCWAGRAAELAAQITDGSITKFFSEIDGFEDQLVWRAAEAAGLSACDSKKLRSEQVEKLISLITES